MKRSALPPSTNDGCAQLMQEQHEAHWRRTLPAAGQRCIPEREP